MYISDVGELEPNKTTAKKWRPLPILYSIHGLAAKPLILAIRNKMLSALSQKAYIILKRFLALLTQMLRISRPNLR